MPHDSCLHDSTIIIIIFNNKTPNNFSIAAETDVFLLVKCFWLPFRYKADFKIYFSITTRKNEEEKKANWPTGWYPSQLSYCPNLYQATLGASIPSALIAFCTASFAHSEEAVAAFSWTVGFPTQMILLGREEIQTWSKDCLNVCLFRGFVFFC